MADQREQRPVLPPPAKEPGPGAPAAAKKTTRKTTQKPAQKSARKTAAAPVRTTEEPSGSSVGSAEASENIAARERAEQERAARLDSAAAEQPVSEPATTEQRAVAPAVPAQQATRGQKKPAAPRRTRKAQLRLVQVDAWSVMKTSFLLSIALGIVLVVAVAIVWSVLGAAGVWDSINSIVQQAVGNATGPQFDITDYLSTSRVLGVAMVVAALDVILITAIATLGAFLYNLSAALLGGVEVTLAEDN